MEILVEFIRFKGRNAKTGDSEILAKYDGKNIICKGVCQSYTRHTPIRLTGNYEKEKFIFDTCSIDLSDKDLAYRYYTTEEFKGIGPAEAGKIIKEIGDASQYVKDNPDEALYQGLYSHAVIVLLRKIRDIVSFEDIYAFMKSRGCSYHNAHVLYKKYGAGAGNALDQNPYTLLESGTSYAYAEKLAKERGMLEYDEKRVCAIVRYILEKNNESGNTRIEIEKLYKMVQILESRAKCGFTTKPVYVAQEVMSDSYRLEYTKDKVFIYLKQDRLSEESIAKDVRRLKTSAMALTDALPIEDVEESVGVKYSKDQKECFGVLKESGIKIITGGPGTGKTTLLNGLLYKYEAENKGKTVALCAPTGRAARRMRESTGKEAKTIYKLLGIRPSDNRRAIHTDKLGADLVVVDEVSMVDADMMALLLASVKNNALVILMGDSEQLPSVGAGNVLSDLIESGAVKTYRLSSVHRQKEGSVILDNSKKILSGRADLKESSNFKMENYENEEKMLKRIERIVRGSKEKIDKIEIYTPSKNPKFRTGAVAINRSLQKILSGVDEENSITHGYYSFGVGDKVIFNRNSYDDAKNFYNGEGGVITSVQKIEGTNIVVVRAEDGAVIELRDEDLDAIDLGYALTAHKSQGGETETAIILVPKKPSSMLLRNLLYVEVTRAKKNVLILSEGDALKKCISSYMEIKRNTGLKDLLVS